MATEFDNVLNQYKNSLLEYKATGNSVFRQQAQASEKWLNDYILTLNQTVQRDAAYIDRFTKEYERTNPELVKYGREIAQVRKEGPKLQDVYEGEQIEKKDVIDESSYYTKAAAVGGILAIAAVVSFF